MNVVSGEPTPAAAPRANIGTANDSIDPVYRGRRLKCLLYSCWRVHVGF